MHQLSIKFNFGSDIIFFQHERTHCQKHIPTSDNEC